MSAMFYLGTHHPSQRWFDFGVPLFVSVRTLRTTWKRRLPTATAPWALDSGGFTEIRDYGRWMTTEDEYVEQVERFREIGCLSWVAPQDWMSEPFMLAKTGLTVGQHQGRTIESFLSLRERIGDLVIPVLQGYTPVEYDRCVDLYADAGVDLAAERIVGLGSVCKRSKTREAIKLVRYLSDHGLRLHGFGLKGDTFLALRSLLASADSMAWSLGGRYVVGCSHGRPHKAENNCSRYALEWRDSLLREPEEVFA